MSVKLRSWLGLHEGEGPRTARLFSFIFLLTSAAVLARSAQRELFLAAYPRSAIPDAFLWSSGVLALASLALSALAERRTLVQLMRGLLIIAVVLLGAAFAVATAWPAGGPMTVFVTVEVLLSLLLSQAWAVTAEGVDVRSAKRLLPLVGFGAGLAWTVGGFAVSGLARLLGPGRLLLVAGAMLVATFGVLQIIARNDVAETPRTAPARPFFVGLWAGLRSLVAEPLTRVLAAIITIELVVEKVTDFQLFAVAQERFAGHGGDLAAFMGLFFGVTGALTLFAPAISGRLLTAFGSTRALVAGQLWILAGSLLFLVAPSFAVVVLLTGGDRCIKQGLTAPARSQVFGALPSVRRTQAGALLRGVVAAFFGALTALSLKAVPSSTPVEWLSLPVVVLLGIVVVLTARTLRNAYLSALQNSVDKSKLDLDAPDRAGPLAREQLAMLQEELDSGDESRGLLALSVLTAQTSAQTRVMLRKTLGHPVAAVQAQAVLALGKTGDASDVPALVSALERATEESVQLACLEALGALKAKDALPALERLKEAPALSVRALARVCRARILEGQGDTRALGEVEAMLHSERPDEREAAAWAIGRVHLQTSALTSHFAPLLGDGSAEVRRAAIGASAQFADEDILRKLVTALEDPSMSEAAFEALTQLEDPSVTGVEKVLTGASPELLTRAVAALAQGRGARVTAALQKWLDHEAPQVRYRASRALVQRRRNAEWRPPGEAVLLRFIETELALGYRYHAALAGLAEKLRAGDAEMRFVAGELESRAQETERRLLALVGVVADPRLARLSHHLRDASPQVTAKVLELIEQSLEPRLAALLVPFLERQSAEQKARIGERRFQVPRSFSADPLEALLSLGDEHLKLVAHVAFKGRLAERLPVLSSEEGALVRLVERVRFLRSVPVFKNLSPEDLMKLAEIASSVSHEKDTVIFRKGDPGDVLCVVVTGCVEIRDRAQVIATQRPNDFFGELALFDQEPRSADAVTVEDTVLLEIGGADLEALMERRPEIAREIIRVLARRLRTTTQQLLAAGRPAS